MTGAGRVGCITAALVSAVLVAACGDSLSAAHCKANGGGNQQAFQSLNALLAKNRDHTSAYLFRAKAGKMLGQIPQDHLSMLPIRWGFFSGTRALKSDVCTTR